MLKVSIVKNNYQATFDSYHTYIMYSIYNIKCKFKKKTWYKTKEPIL